MERDLLYVLLQAVRGKGYKCYTGGRGGQKNLPKLCYVIYPLPLRLCNGNKQNIEVQLKVTLWKVFRKALYS
jgi:hypothetical protein